MTRTPLIRLQPTYQVFYRVDRASKSTHLKANFSKKPAKKIFSLHGGEIEFEFCYIKFEFNFPAM